MSGARFTVVTARVPAMLCKTAGRRPDGSIALRPGGMLAEGEAITKDVGSLADLARTLSGLAADQALVWGVPRGGDCTILSRRMFEAAPDPTGATTRTRGQFLWPDGPGILMLDHDPGETVLDRETLVGRIREAAPGLADVEMLWWPSASSHICDVATGEDLTGLRGQRLYLMVADATDIPRAGKALVDRLWAAGHGRVVPSKAGTALERTLVDASVWQPERLDFAAGANCADGLEQRRGEPHLIFGTTILVDTATALPDDPKVQGKANAVRKRARSEAKDVLAAAREIYLERRVSDVLGDQDPDDVEAVRAARTVLGRAIDHGALDGRFPVAVETGPGTVETMTVGRILDERQTFDGCLTRDPLEPDYDDGRLTGKLFLLDARPTLHSFARGGRTFRLMRAPYRIEIVKGQTQAATDRALDVLREDPPIFEYGGQVALVERGKIAPLDEHALAHHLGAIIQFWGLRRSGDADEPVDLDPPARLVRQILSLGFRRGLRGLVAIVTAPTLRVDGSLIDRPGFDADTGLLFDPGDETVPAIEPMPDTAMVAAALDRLMQPFRDFPFVDAPARGAFLAALLTAVVRPTLPTAPAFAIDAPVQGSGKTLLASCIAALASGAMPEIWPHTASRDDEEVRKRLFTALRSGTSALVWDNVTGILDSAALASAITAPVIRDRILGRSESLAIPNRAILILTGNNLCPAGDLPRRLITARIDPGTDTPFAREFPLDPLDHVLSNRLALVAAALTILRGQQVAAPVRASGRMASFEAWDDLVRQTVVWVGAHVAPGEYGDPLDLVRRAQQEDPEQETLFALLEALADVFPQMWFTARDIAQRLQSSAFDDASRDKNAVLREIISDIAGEKAATSSRSIGRVLKFRVGRIVFGLHLISRPGRNGNEYRVNQALDLRGCGFGGIDSGRSEVSSAGPARDEPVEKSKRPESNPPNPPNPQMDDDPFDPEVWK